MNPRAIDVQKLSDEQLRNIISNHRRKEMTNTSVYIEALAEQARRMGKGLDFDKSFGIIRSAAAECRFVSYKELADASGAEWSRVRYSMGHHLGSLVEYAHRKGWPMLSAIVVNQQNLASGKMEAETLKGFLAAARELNISVTDGEAFLRDHRRQFSKSRLHWTAACPCSAVSNIAHSSLLGDSCQRRVRRGRRSSVPDPKLVERGSQFCCDIGRCDLAIGALHGHAETQRERACRG
jgi:hypothetical protein